jgi:RNA polymerase sigma factor (TIGR02999 family)
MAAAEGVTELLVRWRNGDREALARVIELVYGELHNLARHFMRGERPDHTLQSTALINEAYLRLVGYKEIDWQDRAHFFRVAAREMRRVLVDYARRRKAAKRVDAFKVSLDEAAALGEEVDPAVLELDEILKRMEVQWPRKVEVVELRYFVGLTTDETAKILGIATPTVEREWRSAKAWILQELTKSQPPSV